MLHREIESFQAVWVIDTIRDFLCSAENSMGPGEGEPAWAEPLVGFSRGDDPLYEEFKNDIGPFYWTPEDIFNMSFPERPSFGDNLTVISWVLPQTEATKKDSRKEFWYPPKRWARSRKYGEDCNVRLHDHLIDALLKEGYRAVAPSRSPHWSVMSSERFGPASTWSERHAAYVSGLGTFGLSDGLITPAGKAMRCGSVVARIPIPPTQRPYTDPHAYCLHFAGKQCGACIMRCPAGAISAKGHDKIRCKSYIENGAMPYATSQFGIAARCCGLCQTKVPCESGIPAELRNAAAPPGAGKD